ncbi:alpha/beta fold hydrolase [Skermania sp. ID1734]|uniref:alpha/beta fold hydrolase n=1 Tax=Skermania sp. ID1734 TaxID=2597516 RepID=UPI002107ED3F|nr:alpha/beta hydrolase [Skermania sp. ID1734]
MSAFEDWRASGQYFTHRGHRVFWRSGGVGGSGTLVCIHGFPTASWDWHAVWPALEQQFATVIAIDMIGFGWSDKPRDYQYSILDQADIHENFLADQGISDYHILAHDYGDTVAQELVARDNARPTARIQSVCLLNGGLFPETHRALLVQKLLRTPIGPVLSRLSTRRAFGASLASVFGPDTKPSAAELDEFWRLAHYNEGNRLSHKLIRYIDERRQYRERWVGALQEAKVPVRVIDGLLDPVSGAHMVARYRELIPDADVVELPQIGHYPQVEDPEGTISAFRAFHT